MRSEKLQLKHSSFMTSDGVRIAVQEAGHPAGHEIVFIHGYSQCHLSWSRQLASNLAEKFRLISYDLRGHGGSDKPDLPAFYRDGPRWADELKGVLDHARLRRPVVVAWSYGGRVIADYLQSYGPERFAGINLVASKTRSAPEFVGRDNTHLQGKMASDDLALNIDGTIGFLRACTEGWHQHEFEWHLAFNMLVPWSVRGFLLGRTYDADKLYSSLQIPVLFTHGAMDRVVPLEASIEGHKVTSRGTLSIYENTGHAPFVEAADRFNSELERFVESCALRR